MARVPRSPRPDARRRRSRRARPAPRGLLQRIYFWYRARSWFTRMVLGLGSLGSGLAFCGLVAVMLYYGWLARAYDLSLLGQMPQRSVVVDRHGETIGKLHGMNRTMVPLDRVSQNFTDALLAREDKSFHRHHGIDYYGFARAIVRNLKDRKFTQGASTLTMQLARNSYQMREKSLHRKLTEMMLARRIENACDKNRILELYVNRIFYGRGIYGVERASQVYFGKSAADLTLSEGAILAGVIRGPSNLNPSQFPEKAQFERDTVLNRMVMHGFISKQQAEAVKSKDVVPRALPVINQENYAMDYVRRELDRVLDTSTDSRIVEDGGLKIYTTLDFNLQKGAEKALVKGLDKVEAMGGYRHPRHSSHPAGDSERPTKYVQGSVVAIDNATGGVLALVGGRDYSQSKFNRALQAKRQIGSVFKPFVFAAAYENSSVLPQTLISDDRIQYGELGPGSKWSPSNSDGSFRGYRPAGYGLVNSRNTMSVRVGQRAGIDNVIAVGRPALSDAIPHSPVSFIGTFETTLKAVTGAYSIFPNGGVGNRPFLISRIETHEGSVIYEAGQLRYPVVSAGAAALVGDSLREVMEKGTGASARRLGWTDPCAGKTGTTDDYRDAWFVGYTSSVSCGVWVGMDKPQTTVSRGYGSTLALPVWVDVMKNAKRLGYPAGELPKGPTRRNMHVCRLSGGLPTSSCQSHGSAISVWVPEDLAARPREHCRLHRGYAPAVAGPRRAPRARQTRRSDQSRGVFGRIIDVFR